MKYNFFIGYSNEDKSIEREAVFLIDKKEIIDSKPNGVLTVIKKIIDKLQKDITEKKVIEPQITIQIREELTGKIIYDEKFTNTVKTSEEINEIIK